MLRQHEREARLSESLDEVDHLAAGMAVYVPDPGRAETLADRARDGDGHGDRMPPQRERRRGCPRRSRLGVTRRRERRARSRSEPATECDRRSRGRPGCRLRRGRHHRRLEWRGVGFDVRSRVSQAEEEHVEHRRDRGEPERPKGDGAGSGAIQHRPCARSERFGARDHAARDRAAAPSRRAASRAR